MVDNTNFLSLFFLASGLLTACDSVNPGFQTALTSKGLNYIVQVGLPILKSELSNLQIPDISGKAGSPIGNIDYELHNIKLTQISIPTASITSSSAGLVVQVSGMSLGLSADWHYKMTGFPYISDSGSADVSASSIGMKVTVMIGVDTKGHATLKASGCSLNIGHLSIKFHGGASWLYNLFSSYIADALKGNIQSQVCSQAVNAINTQGNKALESLPIISNIDSTSEINYALTKAPAFTSTYVSTDHKGEFFSRKAPAEAPFSPPPMPGVTKTDKMLYVWLSDYMADTAGYVYQQAGVMQYELTPENTHIPSGIPFHLNTTSFKLFLPQLYNKFPNEAMLLNLSAVKPPDLTISPTAINFTLPGQVDVLVRSANKTIQNAFTLGVIMYASVDVAIHSSGNQENITGKANFLRATLSLVKSNIGTFDVSLLQTSVNTLCTLFVIPALNVYAGVGFPIPTVDGVSFVGSTIELEQDVVMIGTDINYKPSFWHS
jgi:lipopolysaccharide-binding protein